MREQAATYTLRVPLNMLAKRQAPTATKGHHCNSLLALSFRFADGLGVLRLTLVLPWQK